MSKKLIVVDISGFIFRAFFAIRPLHAPDKTPVNAVYGILNMMLKLMGDQKPSHMVLARDSKEKSFRSEIYTDYKANRSSPPDDLIPQFALIDQLVDKMNLPSVRMPGFEADDLIGSIVVQYKDQFDEVFIVSGDKDLMQFVGGNVFMLDTMKDVLYGRQEVFEKMGVYPEQVADYLSLVGDSSDNIPGVAGIGAKGAAKLLEEFGSLENCLNNAEKISGKKAQQSIIDGKASALLSKQLVAIKTDLEMDLSKNKMELHFHPSTDLIQFLEQIGFHSSVTKLKKLEEKSSNSKDVTPVSVGAAVELIPFNLEDWTSLEPLVGININWPAEEMGLIPPRALLINSKGVTEVPGDAFDSMLEKIFNADITVVGPHLKKIVTYLFRKNISLKSNVFDLVQAHFDINPAGKHDLSAMVQQFFDESVAHDEIKASGKIIELHKILSDELTRLELELPFYELDTPLLPILAGMEAKGILLDVKMFKQFEDEFEKELKLISENIKLISGVEVNLNSPKQVGVLLFEKLGLPVVKETKTGPSTDSEVLEELASLNMSEIPDLIIKFRELDKLQSTYVKALPKLVDAETGRLHTHFHQHVAATGRLSSDQPNLQNIPIRTENGRRLRQGFVASEGKLLLGADYSQIELRLLAHFSEDPTMVKAFLQDQDIHAQTAAEVFDVPLTEVTKDQRSFAKAVNFGLMYGQSSFGLAQALRISRKEAQNFITRYFARFSSVKGYLDSLKELAEKTGYSITYYGRKRFLPDIHSTNRTVKSMAERMAVNSPIQGTAADIIKKAMILVDKELREQKLEAKMILQVHDELIFEFPPHEEDILRSLVKQGMERIVSLKVPLKVDVGVGKSWSEL